ncbi:MAG: hypothetical protein FWG40_04865 [Peptococcaceae bacterium]|nr:hypothetical protein [Peptococcaceae bacterium]
MKKRVMCFLLTVCLMMFMFPAAAGAADEVLGTLRDTSDGSAWMVKYLGGPNKGTSTEATSDESFNWAAQRSYSNGLLNTAGYTNGFAISDATAQSLVWNRNNQWISINSAGRAANGYYSYVTILADDVANKIAPDKKLSFNGLGIGYASDDHLHAIIINGVKYSGFSPQAVDHKGWLQNQVNIKLSSVPWNVNGSNTVEFIVHNNNSGDPKYGDVSNPTGFSASIRAIYLSEDGPNVPKSGF